MMRSVRDELARVVGFREDRRRAHPTRDLIRRPHATQEHDPWRPLRPAPVLRGELIAAHARAEIQVENDHICRDRRQSIWVVVHDQHTGLVFHGFAKSNDPPRAFVATYFRIGTAPRLTGFRSGVELLQPAPTPSRSPLPRSPMEWLSRDRRSP